MILGIIAAGMEGFTADIIMDIIIIRAIITAVDIPPEGIITAILRHITDKTAAANGIPTAAQA
jgi:hypothetical protein